MDNITYINKLPWVSNAEDVIKHIEEIIIDSNNQNESLEEKQKVVVEFTIYELELLINKIKKRNELRPNNKN